MSETTKVYSSNDERKVVISNQEATARKWKFDTIFKVIAGILYGFFFGLLPASFYFNDSLGADPTNVPNYEICAIVSILSVGILSIATLFWLYKGDIKRHHPYMYSLMHLFNAILLSVGILVAIIAYPNSYETIEGAKPNLDRYLILGISYAGYAVVISIITLVALFIYRRQYPLSWSKALYGVATFVFVSIVDLFVYLSVNAQSGEENLSTQETMWLVIALVSFIVSILSFSLGIAFVKRFRDVLLGERTANEIETIRDWESVRVLSIIISAVTVITFCVALLINKSSDMSFELPLIIEVVIDCVVLLPYIVILSYIKIQNINNTNKSFFITKIFKSIDNGLLLDICAWIILVKMALLQGIYLEETNSVILNNSQAALLSIIGFGSLFVLYAFTVIISLNVPNLRNTAISIPTLAFAIILGLFVVLFAAFVSRETINAGNINVSQYVFLFMPIVLLVGTSISLIVKIFVIAKIFKVNWARYKTYDKSYLIAEQQKEENNQLLDDSKEFKTKKDKTATVETSKTTTASFAKEEGVRG